VRMYDKAAGFPQMHHIDYGLTVFRKEVFARHAERFDLAEVMKDLAGRREMAAFAVAERFYEIGSLEGIADLEKLLRRANRVVFFDRDGILNEIVMRGGGVESPRTAGEFRIKSGAIELFQTARAAGFLCIVVTNQPDIERGLLAQAELDAMHRVLAEELSPDGIEVCPAGSADDRRKKPNPGMLLDAAERWGIDLRQSWIVGDSDKDIEAGRRAGIGTILLATEYNNGVQAAADFCFPSLAEIARFISTTREPKTR